MAEEGTAEGGVEGAAEGGGGAAAEVEGTMAAEGVAVGGGEGEAQRGGGPRVAVRPVEEAQRGGGRGGRPRWRKAAPSTAWSGAVEVRGGGRRWHGGGACEKSILGK